MLTSPGLSSTDAEFQRCLNVHAFTALLTKSHLIPLPRKAILAIGQATEGATVQEEDGGPEFVSNYPLDIEQLDMKVAVAAIWIQHAGHVLWRHNPRYTIGEGGPLWKEFYERLSKEDPNYLSLYRERWGVWVLQFGKFQRTVMLPRRLVTSQEMLVRRWTKFIQCTSDVNDPIRSPCFRCSPILVYDSNLGIHFLLWRIIAKFQNKYGIVNTYCKTHTRT